MGTTPLALSARWETLGLDVDTLALDEAGTLVRQLEHGCTVSVQGALEATLAASRRLGPFGKVWGRHSMATWPRWHGAHGRNAACA